MKAIKRTGRKRGADRIPIVLAVLSALFFLVVLSFYIVRMRTVASLGTPESKHESLTNSEPSHAVLEHVSRQLADCHACANSYAMLCM